ncbi:MAG: 23S rRNA (guanosine(2251)-2'-O)-methyltransferase RlmB [Deltaproteobacteria bacterium]|nr:23S rRNA (guanosine(2251)-2'-O)-methyltransferase RlmB [Deltaproteobacteria bacterium]
MAYRHFKSSKASQQSSRRSHHEDQGRLDLVYGKNPVYEALRAGRRRVKQVLVLENDPQMDGTPLVKLAREKGVACQQRRFKELTDLTMGAAHQGVVAYVEKFPPYTLDEVLGREAPKQLVLALDCIQDPQNFGTLCRSALCFGVTEIILPKDRSVSVTSAVCKASAGAVEHLKIIYVTNLSRTLDEFKERGFWVYGASLDKTALDLNKVEPAHKSVIVLGSEGSGLRRLVAEKCDHLVKIEMTTTFDSLNVAQAGTVLLYKFARML